MSDDWTRTSFFPLSFPSNTHFFSSCFSQKMYMQIYDCHVVTKNNHFNIVRIVKFIPEFLYRLSRMCALAFYKASQH